MFSVNQLNGDLYLVFLAPNGAPAFSAFNNLPWVYGRLVSAQFISANVVRATWSISVSSGGFNATFFQIGFITQDFAI